MIQRGLQRGDDGKRLIPPPGAGDTMQTRTQDIESLFLDGVFNIPEYQRSYSWEQDQLDDFLEDLRYLPEDRTHFFGNVILEKGEERYETESRRKLDVYRVVDGQQRLTTALIFLKVASNSDVDLAESIEEANLIQIPQERPRLLPQDQDGEFFRDHILVLLRRLITNP
jgi:uncharacterized protein with ParB-like and HNH nuclease domain